MIVLLLWPSGPCILGQSRHGRQVYSQRSSVSPLVSRSCEYTGFARSWKRIGFSLGIHVDITLASLSGIGMLTVYIFRLLLHTLRG